MKCKNGVVWLPSDFELAIVIPITQNLTETNFEVSQLGWNRNHG